MLQTYVVSAVALCMGSIALTFSNLFLEAAYRFYKTRCEEDSAKRRGKSESMKKAKRRHERVVRVSNSRAVLYVVTVF